MDNMNFNNYEEIDGVELWAEDNHLIQSEEELSERFDQEIASMVIDQYGDEDGPAMREAFNNWSDMLCKDGELHSLQYSNYCYVGKYEASHF